jgi:hypothetical protein
MTIQRILKLVGVLIIGFVIFSACQDSNFVGATRTVDESDAKKASGPTDDPRENDDKKADESEDDDDNDKDKKKDLDENSDIDTVNSDKTDDEISTDADIARLEDEEIETEDGSIKVGRCSPDYTVPGTANIYLAGTASGTSISYKKGAPDRMPAQSPLLAVPDVKKCLKAGAKIYLKVSGQISHGSTAATNADGKMSAIYNHEKNVWLGKSDIKAPLNSLVGVFLSDEDPSSASGPATLNFETESERDYKTISPKKGQVFFIGDGKTNNGKNQKIVVPDGVTRLYLGIMDVFEWNNNSGSLTGAILIQK